MRFHLLYFLISLFWFGCTKNEQNENQVARVGEAVLTNEDLSFASVYTDKERMSFVDNWINTELLFQAGVYADLGRDILLDSKIKQYRKKLIGQTFLDTQIKNSVFVSKDEVRSYYTSNKEEFKRLKNEATINSFYIVDKKEANRVRANLEKSSSNKKRNEMFEKHGVVAETFSDGQLHSKINNKVFSSKKNKYIGPISFNDGYFVVEVVKRYEKGTYLGLDSVYDKIYLLIYKRKAAIKTQAIIDSLKQSMSLEINSSSI